jgi:molecular chaperone GrpE
MIPTSDTYYLQLQSQETVEKLEQKANEANEASGEHKLSIIEQSLVDQLQRLSAEYANYQKRVQKDKQKWTQDAIIDFIRGFLPILDSMEISINFGNADEAVKKGLSLIWQEILNHCKKHDVVPIKVELGSQFNSEKHEAVIVREVEDIEGLVVDSIARTGYMYKNIVLRPTQVIVLKGLSKNN